MKMAPVDEENRPIFVANCDVFIYIYEDAFFFRRRPNEENSDYSCRYYGRTDLC